MIFILTSFITVIILFIILGLYGQPMVNNIRQLKFKFNKKQFLALFGFLILIIPCFTLVPPNHVGIKFNIIGGVSSNTIKEGLQMKNPLDEIYLISTEVQTVKIDKVTGQTKDAQWVNMNLDVKYKVNPKNAFVVFKNFRDLYNVNSTLIIPLTQRAIEQVTTEYNVIDVLGEKRNEVYAKIEQQLKSKLEQSGIDFFALTLTDTDAGAGIEEAIANEAIAKKNVETSLQKQEQAKVEAETLKIEAAANAEVKLIQAKAEADSNKIISNSITQNVLKKMEMDARKIHGWIEVNTNGNSVIETKR